MKKWRKGLNLDKQVVNVEFPDTHFLKCHREYLFLLAYRTLVGFLYAILSLMQLFVFSNVSILEKCKVSDDLMLFQELQKIAKT